jgi:hypothetical protein
LQAVKTYGLHPYVDRSCRREPDFEAIYPSITALCRTTKFAPRIHERDIVVYITHQGKYVKGKPSHWRLVAILGVVKRFETHQDAADWYINHGCILPRNCMVEGNDPLPIEMTYANPQTITLKWWDRQYRNRATQCGVFLACEKEFLELKEPPIITREKMGEIFGRIPITRTPPTISREQLDGLKKLAVGVG